MLSGVRVIELGQGVAAPFCGMMLADCGAEVIKIEAPPNGDMTRQWAPPFVDHESAYFMSVNRGKKSIVVDLKTSKGVDVFKRLCEKSDIVLENFRPGAIERLGLGYQTLKGVNPLIILCSITGYGQDGPSAGDAAFDLIIQARSGLMDITGEPGGDPIKLGVPIVDIGAGMYAAFAISLALMKRKESGIGSCIDISLLDTAVSWLSYWMTGHEDLRNFPRRTGSAHVTIAPYQVFRVCDGYVAIGASTDKLWTNLCHSLGMEELLMDKRFVSNPLRVEHRKELVELLDSRVRTMSRKELLQCLAVAEVPGAAVQTIEEVLEDPQVLHRKMALQLNHLSAGPILVPGSPVNLELSGSAGHGLPSSPPLLGQHTVEILTALHYSEAEIEDLLRSGACSAYFENRKN